MKKRRRKRRRKMKSVCCAEEAMERLYQGVASRVQNLRRRIRQKLPSPVSQDDDVIFNKAGKSRPLLLPQPFPTIDNSAAPQPSALWSSSLLNSPLPTNTAWQNFILKEGSVPEFLHPYIIELKDGRLSLCFPYRLVHPAYIIQAYVPNLTIGSSDAGTTKKHVVTAFDDLSVTLELPGHVTVPLVRGCPYITCVFNDFTTPTFSTEHAVLNLTSNRTSTKHKVSMNNGQTWLIYSSNPLPLTSNLVVNNVFKGVIRIAVLGGNTEAERILDRFSSTYPLGGHANISVPFQVIYEWRKNDTGELLMLSLPMHREIMSSPSADCIYPSVSYNSIDGEMQAVMSDSWVLNESPIDIGWYSSKGISEPGNRRKISDVLRHEIASLQPIITDSTYFHGKALARVARIAMIAEEVRCLDVVHMARDFLRKSITPWMEGSFSGNALLYDPKWGGLVSRNGVRDPGADFGFGLYNDHHYHLGYFCYAGAVLAKLDPKWGTTYRAHLYTIAEDFMTLNHHHIQSSEMRRGVSVFRSAPLFPSLRNFDFWVLHSWAGGLMEFADGRNEESTSEAVNAYYAASLLGKVFKDSSLVNAGLTLAAFEIRAARTLWHVPSNCSLYEPEFVSENRMVGVLWSNKRDTGLWFGPPEWKEFRLGIQLLPILPITEFLFQDVEFVKELVEWAWPSLSRPDVKDGWKGFAYALQALYAPEEALQNIAALKEHDDGNSLSNLLWWVYSR